MVFSFSSVASPKTGRSECDNLFPGEHLHLRRLLLGENPSGHEVGISLRPITLLPDEKECYVPPIGYNRDD